jgi:hypothetical protein
LAELEREIGSNRKKTNRSEESFDLPLTSTGSGYGSSRRYEASSSIATRAGRSSLLADDDEQDDVSKFAPRRLGRLAALKSSYRSEDDADDNPTASSSLSLATGTSSSYAYKRSRYTASRLPDDDDEPETLSSVYSSTLRKYSSSGSAAVSAARDEPYELGESRYSSRFRSRANDDDDDISLTGSSTSRLLGRPASLTRAESSDEYGGKRSYSLNREASAAATTSRYSRYTSADSSSGKAPDGQEVDMETESSRIRRSRYERDSSREDESLSTTGSRFAGKRYSRETSVASAATTSDVLRELAGSNNNGSNSSNNASNLFRSERRNSDRELTGSSKVSLFESDLSASKRSLPDANSTLDEKVCGLRSFFVIYFDHC